MMNSSNEQKTYMQIGASRLLDIRVILDGQEVYSGMVEDAPDVVKQLKYSKVDMGSKMTYYVYSQLNQ